MVFWARKLLRLSLGAEPESIRSPRNQKGNGVLLGYPIRTQGRIHFFWSAVRGCASLAYMRRG